MGMFCPLHSLVETVKSTNLDFSNKLSMKMIKGMMTSDFWRVISEVIRGGELLTRGRSESKLTRHKGQFLSSFANNPSPPPPSPPVLERCKVITEQCAKSIGRKLSTRLKLVMVVVYIFKIQRTQKQSAVMYYRADCLHQSVVANLHRDVPKWLVKSSDSGGRESFTDADSQLVS